MITPMARTALEGWLKTETWHTNHPLDERRFFRAVWAVIRQGGERPTEEDVEQMILDQGRLHSDFLKERARKYASLYVTLCDFADERPNA